MRGLRGMCAAQCLGDFHAPPCSLKRMNDSAHKSPHGVTSRRWIVEEKSLLHGRIIPEGESGWMKDGLWRMV